ncbi:MAG: hypothetical protein JW816_02460 [Candidatus Buchananbacteria bacterium]|nr:hypothetical protein [Candidatus Buchananbacteria bacterium]
MTDQTSQAMTTEQPKAAQHGAKTLFWYFSLFWTMAITAFSVGAIWFQLINKFFPMEVNYLLIRNAFSQTAIKSAIAALIVGAPVFFLFTWLIRKSIKKEEIKLKSGARMWIGYLILFIVVATAVGDIITIVWKFLNGDFTSRFLLKSLVILAITGWTFIYFWLSLKSDDGLKNSKLPRMFVITSAVAVIISLIIGFTLIDSPATARAKSYDLTRENDLRNISSSVDNYFNQSGKLPASLEDLKPIEGATDPITHQPYRYKTLSDTQYQLCATFQTDNQLTTGEKTTQVYNQNNFLHSQGEQCFDLKVNDWNGKQIIIR